MAIKSDLHLIATSVSNGHKMLIAIDPDVEKSGVSILRNGELSLHSLTFFELFDLLKLYDIMQIDMIYIEASWLLNKTSFVRSKGKGFSEKTGADIGANRETGKKIVEMCEYLKIPYTEVRPLKKIWKGPHGKITHEEFNKQAKTSFKRTNQEERDAGLILITR